MEPLNEQIAMAVNAQFNEDVIDSIAFAASIDVRVVARPVSILDAWQIPDRLRGKKGENLVVLKAKLQPRCVRRLGKLYPSLLSTVLDGADVKMAVSRHAGLNGLGHPTIKVVWGPDGAGQAVAVTPV
jgi:hypothetical protein